MILVVDDDRAVRDLFTDTLAEIGHDVAQAADASQALQQLRTGLTPCLIVSDVRMPGIDGWDFAHAIQRERPELPMLLVTADKMLSFMAPVRDKPTSPEELEALIRTTCPATAGRNR